MTHALIHSLLECLKSLPIIFIAYLIVEYISKKTGNEFNRKMGGKKGPLFGSLLGAIPQCGLSAMASNFYSYRIISLGTLFAVYLSTSDEAFIIMLSHPDRLVDLVIVFASKILLGMLFGFIIDAIFKKQQVKDMNEYEIVFGCGCGDNLMLTALQKTAKILLYLFVASFAINLAIEYIGEDQITAFITSNSLIQPLIAPLIGLIPSCVPSVILTELFLSGSISYSGIIGGLLTSAGVGTLVLFRYNKKSLKENILILVGLYGIGVLVGLIIELIMFII